MGTALLLAVSAALFVGVGCGSSDSSSSEQALKPSAAQLRAEHQAREQVKEQRAATRHRARVRARKVAELQRARRHHRLEVRQEQRQEAEARRIALAEDHEQQEAEEAEAATEEESSECDPNYSGCLSAYASDYDCEGGSGDGPEYTGEVAVLGEDHYGLDADSDGVGCEP